MKLNAAMIWFAPSVVCIACARTPPEAGPEQAKSKSTPSEPATVVSDAEAPNGDAHIAALQEQKAVEYESKFTADAQISATQRATAEQKIQDAFAQVQGVTILEPPECRATLCRMTIKAGSEREFEGIVHEVKGVPHGDRAPKKIYLHAGITVPRRTVASDGSVTATIFIKGHLQEP